MSPVIARTQSVVLFWFVLGLVFFSGMTYQDFQPEENTVKQGDVFAFNLDATHLPPGSVPKTMRIRFHKLTREVPLYPQPSYSQKDGQKTLHWEGLMPIQVSDPVGPAVVEWLDGKRAVLFNMPVEIQNGKFRRQNIQVSSQTKGLEPEPGELEAVERLKRDTGPQKYWQVPLLAPTPDCANSPFGVLRYHNGVYTGNYHKGLDFKSPMGRPVKATAGGDVKIAKKMRLHGGTIGLDHGQGLSSIYIHLSKITVKTGQHVRAGDVIGEVGATGFATGPHLHWGLFVNGVPINPLQWLPQAKTCF